MCLTQNPTYSSQFFDYIEHGSLQSARAIIPIILELVRLQSVVDVGCGRGAWLKAFQENGVPYIQGIDGEYVDRDKLLIPVHAFSPMNLSKPFVLHRTYDLAVCLEVAEHLPIGMSRCLVRALTTAAPLVLFSAAIPGQGGTNHINEQWPSYWQGIFNDYGYVLVDAVRPRVRNDRRVAWWYRQNVVLYASRDQLYNSEVLKRELEWNAECDIEWIYACVVKNKLDNSAGSVRDMLKAMSKLILAAVSRRARRLLTHGNRNIS